MNDQEHDAIRFTLNGQRHELSHAMVEARSADVAAETIRKHAAAQIEFWWVHSDGTVTRP